MFLSEWDRANKSDGAKEKKVGGFTLVLSSAVHQCKKGEVFVGDKVSTLAVSVIDLFFMQRSYSMAENHMK